MHAQDRFPKQEGRYRVLFARADKVALTPTAAEKSDPAAPDLRLLAVLKRYDIGGKAASNFIAAHPAAFIEQKIDYLDFLIENGEPPKNPAGWLRRAIEEDFGPPARYTPKTERERLIAEEAERKRRHEEERRQKQQAQRKMEERADAERKRRREHIDDYLHHLQPAERDVLEQRALAKADDFCREMLKGDGPFADATREKLIDEEVLRLHPLPATQSTY
jgi:hypothetical protein